MMLFMGDALTLSKIRKIQNSCVRFRFNLLYHHITLARSRFARRVICTDFRTYLYELVASSHYIFT